MRWFHERLWLGLGRLRQSHTNLGTTGKTTETTTRRLLRSHLRHHQSMTNDGRDMSIDYKLSGPYFKDIPTVASTDEEIFCRAL
jgi:hypothetical protein